MIEEQKYRNRLEEEEDNKQVKQTKKESVGSNISLDSLRCHTFYWLEFLNYARSVLGLNCSQ
jgi:hypothetical protein